MNAAAPNYTHDKFVGYFASVVIALFTSGWIALNLVEWFGAVSGHELTDNWRTNLSSGLFLGIVAANPVNTVLEKLSYRPAAIRFGLGFIAGVLIQISLFTPIAGEGMSTFLMLLLSSLAVPASISLAALRRGLAKKGIDPTAGIVRHTLRAVNYSNRLNFIILMGLSFICFWTYTTNFMQVVYALALVLIGLIISVTRREADCSDDDCPEEVEYLAWLELDPDKSEDDPVKTLGIALRKIVITLLPGAVLFGGVIRIAVDFVLLTYPGLVLDFTRPLEAMQNLTIIAASGLGVILFGMMAALGICIGVLRLIGSRNKWSKCHLRENYVHIIRLLYFRPFGWKQT